MIEINARFSEGPSPCGFWLWFTALSSLRDERYPLPAWYCTREGEPHLIFHGWLPTSFDHRV